MDCFIRLHVLMWYFWKKACNAIAVPEKRYLLRHSDLKIAHQNWIFSKYYILYKLGNDHALFRN